jgi:hypothetical protein
MNISIHDLTLVHYGQRIASDFGKIQLGFIVALNTIDYRHKPVLDSDLLTFLFKYSLEINARHSTHKKSKVLTSQHHRCPGDLKVQVLRGVVLNEAD